MRPMLHDQKAPTKKGYYADPQSPIASTPCKKRKRQAPEDVAAMPPPSALDALASPRRKAETDKQAAKEYQKRHPQASQPAERTSQPQGKSESEKKEIQGTAAVRTPTKAPESPEKKKHSASKVPDGTHGGEVPEEKWGGKVVQTLFSPVLKFFGTNAAEEHEKHVKDHHRQSPVKAKEPDPETPSPARPKPRLSLVTRENVQEQPDAEVEADIDGDTDELHADEEEEWDEDDVDDFNPYVFMKYLPPYHEAQIGPARVWLPKQTRRSPAVTLALDLDETLVHCSVESAGRADVIFPVDFNGKMYEVRVRKRPHLDFFLEQVHKMFEIVVFTASQQVYAEKLLNILDPGRRLVRHRLYRDACLPVEGNFLKDLNVLGRDLSKVILVDNSPHAFGYQVDNGVPIESWFDDDGDTELLKLLTFLKPLAKVEDVRPRIAKSFRVAKLIAECE